MNDLKKIIEFTSSSQFQEIIKITSSKNVQNAMKFTSSDEYLSLIKVQNQVLNLIISNKDLIEKSSNPYAKTVLKTIVENTYSDVTIGICPPNIETELISRELESELLIEKLITPVYDMATYLEEVDSDASEYLKMTHEVLTLSKVALKDLSDNPTNQNIISSEDIQAIGNLVSHQLETQLNNKYVTKEELSAIIGELNENKNKSSLSKFLIQTVAQSTIGNLIQFIFQLFIY